MPPGILIFLNFICAEFKWRIGLDVESRELRAGMDTCCQILGCDILDYAL